LVLVELLPLRSGDPLELRRLHAGIRGASYWDNHIGGMGHRCWGLSTKTSKANAVDVKSCDVRFTSQTHVREA
jgi:hypothetical protein